MAGTALKMTFAFTMGVVALGVVLSKGSEAPVTASVPTAAKGSATESVSPVAALQPAAKEESSTADKAQIDQSEHAVAAMINLNGELCAKVVDVRPLKMRDLAFEVTCVEYRGGSGKVRYLVNGETGAASRL